MFVVLPAMQNIKQDDFVKNIYDMIRIHTNYNKTQCYIPDLTKLVCNFFKSSSNDFELLTLLKQHSEMFVVTNEDSYVYCYVE